MWEKLLGLPLNASAHGARIDGLIVYVHILMFVLFIGWGLFFVYLLAKYRRGKHPKADYVGVRSHTSSYVEAVVVILEVILLVGFSIPFWAWKVSAFPADDQAIHVHIIAQQFAWNVHYPGPDGKFGRTELKLLSDDNAIGLDRKDKNAKDDVVTINQLYLPVNKPVIINITSKDVIHSFFLPLLRVKQDAIPGMSIPIHFTPTQTTEEIREQMQETLTLPTDHKLELYVPLEDYKAQDGTVIAAKGKIFTSKSEANLLAAGISSIRVAPSTPIEIACAQLCGINHYRMKGFLTIVSQAEYDKWLAARVAEAKEDSEE